MKKGILGLGNASTLFYIDEIHKKFQLVNGGYSTCPFILYQINFDEINPFLPRDFDVLVPKIQDYFVEIRNVGIEKILIPNITLHETVDKIETDIEIVHAIDLTIKKLQEKKIERIVLFGTIFTMNSAYIKEKFNKKDIEIILPDVADQIFIDDFRKNVYSKSETSVEISKFQNICYLYSQQNPVVLACTELSIHQDENKELFDMVQIQIEEFLK